MPFNVEEAAQEMHDLSIKYADICDPKAIPLVADKLVELAAMGYRPRRLAEAILHKLNAMNRVKWRTNKDDSVLMRTPGMKGLW